MYINSSEHAQGITGNDFIIIPPHNFEHPSCWYYHVQEVRKSELAEIACGTMSIPNSMHTDCYHE
jgi:hypothetical protein